MIIRKMVCILLQYAQKIGMIFFGEIKNAEMILNGMGLIAEKFWREISVHFPFIEIDTYQIMPNHLHGIIVINRESIYGEKTLNQKNGLLENHSRDAINRVSTDADYCKPQIVNKSNCKKQPGGITGIHNPMGKNTLGEIIRWYKGRYKFESRLINKNFTWQPRFYDHIIRNEKSLSHIRDYIADNPAKWEMDRNNMNDLWM